MFYPQEIIDEVRTRNDIVPVISQYVKLKKRGGSYFGCCPFHNEKTPSFSVSPSRQPYHCFGCGVGGNVISFVMEYENQTFPEAVRTLADRAGIALPEVEQTQEEKREAGRRAQMLAAYKEAAKYYYYQLKSPAGARAREYFARRGLSEETVVKFGLGYSLSYRDSLYRYLKKKGFRDDILSESGLVRISERGVMDYFWNRAMFPIMDGNRKVIAFGGRVMGDGEPKYLNSPENPLFDKSRNLYGLHLARRSRRPYFLLCEGYMDVIAMHQAGFDCAVASLGTALTPGHANLIRRFVKEVILCYDSDGAGIKAAMRAIPILSAAGISARVLDLRPHKDPDEFMVHLGAEAFEERIRGAVNSFLFESDVIAGSYDMTDPEQKTAFHRAVARKLISFEDELERENYLQAVAERHMIPAEALRGMVRRESMSVPAEPEQPREEAAAPIRRRKKKETGGGLAQSERMLLCWAVSPEGKPERLSEYLTPEDFTDEICRMLAEELWPAARRGEVISASALMDRYAEDEEMRGRISEVFAADLPEELSEAESDRILAENIRRVKRHALDEEARKTQDPARMQQIIREKANIEKQVIRLQGR